MVKYWQNLILMSIFCQFSSLTSSIYWQIQYKTKKLNTNISWKPYVRFPSNKNYIDQCTQSDMMNLFKWSYSQFLFSRNIVSNLLNVKWVYIILIQFRGIPTRIWLALTAFDLIQLPSYWSKPSNIEPYYRF